MLEENDKKQLLDDTIMQHINSSVWTALPATIKKCDTENGTVEAKPFGGMLIGGEYVEYPAISGVYVLHITGNGGKAGISSDIKEGAQGVLLFVKNGLDEYIRKYIKGQAKWSNECVLPSFRYNDAVFISGFYPLENNDSENMTIYNENSKIEVRPSDIHISTDGMDATIGKSSEITADSEIKASVGGGSSLSIGGKAVHIKVGKYAIYVADGMVHIEDNGNSLQLNDKGIFGRVSGGKIIDISDGTNGVQINSRGVFISGEIYFYGDVHMGNHTINGISPRNHLHKFANGHTSSALNPSDL